MKSKFTTVAAAVALWAGLTGAARADSDQFVVLSPVGSTTDWTGNFTSTVAAADGAFTDTFEFYLVPFDNAVTFSGTAGNGISFSSVTLTYFGGDGASLPLSTNSVSPGSYSASAADLTSASYTLTVTGMATAGATYTGTITTTVGLEPTSPVPEPQSWAMMLAGLGLTAVALRKRRSVDA